MYNDYSFIVAKKGYGILSDFCEKLSQICIFGK